MSDQSPISMTGAIPVSTEGGSRFTFDTRTAIVVWMMVSMFAIIVLCWWKPPDATNQILNTLLGVYGATGFVTTIQWWMGSSKGSDDKTALLKKD